jgi:predicted nucleotidyltransferase
MTHIVKTLSDKRLITPPHFVPESAQLLIIMGSVAYGVSSDTSDMDVYGFCIPPKHMVFPHLAGEILGFGDQIQRFEQFQQHHVVDTSTQKEYDFTIYGIVKYFQLCMENNPNMIDSLFVPQRCVLYSTEIGEMVRSNRRLFLHAGAYHKFKGYAYSQMSKLQRVPDETSRRRDDYDKFGYSTKFAYHLVRLLSEAEMILTEQDLDLTRNREQLKAIRRGEMTLDQLGAYFSDQERILHNLYQTTQLPKKPNESAIKQLLIDCLEQYYGSIDNCVAQTDPDAQIKLNQIRKILGY